MEQYHIGILVTKDGGKKGGFLEKQEAARLQKAALVVIGRPTQEEGYSVEEAWNLVLESLYAKETLADTRRSRIMQHLDVRSCPQL